MLNQDLLISSLWNGETVKEGYPRRSAENEQQEGEDLQIVYLQPSLAGEIYRLAGTACWSWELG